jgi:peroxiredoxin 2/4
MILGFDARGKSFSMSDSAPQALPVAQAGAKQLRPGDTAPDFIARSTMGAVSLSDYRGRWLVLIAHPADFTPVCTSEFVSLTRAAPSFAALGCALLAVSVDSLYAHLAWVRDIRDHFGININFPIIEDPSMVIGRAYGMIADGARDSGTMRSSFFIDPAGILRAIICYPSTVGHSVDEMLRLVAALQRVDSAGVVTPEGWQPGMDALMPPDIHQDAMPETDDDGVWFHRIARAARGTGA